MLGRHDIESKLMFLQLNKRRERFLSILRCTLVQKGRYASAQNDRLVRAQLCKDMNKLGFLPIPKARLAVTLHFYASHPDAPQLPKLVKYLLDVLCTEVCRDDRQVEYLSCCCYRPSKAARVSSRLKESVYVEVERLSDLLRLARVFRWLLGNHEFLDFAKDRTDRNRLTRGNCGEIEDLWPDAETAEFMNLPQATVRDLHSMIRRENQQKLLMINRLGAYDWPGARKNTLFEILRPLSDANPFVFEMYELPSTGGQKEYRSRLRTKLKELNRTFPGFGRILAPMELDIQVTPAGSTLTKDLDNIILQVSNAFTEELLENGSYLHGYRIYVTRNGGQSGMNHSILFRLLPAYEISDFERFFGETLKLGVEWLRDQTRQ